MRALYLLPILVLALSSNAFSGGEALLRFGPGLRHKLERTQEGSLTARLDAIRLRGRGPASAVPVCYEGKKRDVCQLLSDAVAMKNSEERIPSRIQYELTYCETNERGAIVVDIAGSDASLELPPIPVCGPSAGGHS